MSDWGMCEVGTTVMCLISLTGVCVWCEVLWST